MKAETCHGSEVCMLTMNRSSSARLVFSHGRPLLILPQIAPAAGRMGPQGLLPGQPACLLAPGSSCLAKRCRGKNRSLSLIIQLLGLSYLFHSLSLSLTIQVLSLFLSCTACCFPSSPLPPLSVKCQSNHRMSSSAFHPLRLCLRTQQQLLTHSSGVGPPALPLMVFRSRMGVKVKFEGFTSLHLPLSG